MNILFLLQVVKNPNKIKKMKKRDLAKRDILGKVWKKSFFCRIMARAVLLDPGINLDELEGVLTSVMWIRIDRMRISAKFC